MTILSGKAIAILAASVAIIICIGCTASNSLQKNAGEAVHSHDIREIMLASAQARNGNFPNGKEEKLTQFAYIGTVRSNSGEIRVALCRSILPNMLSPRGQAWLSFHAAMGLGSVRIRLRPPHRPCGAQG